MTKDILLSLIILLNNLFLIVLVFSLLPKKIQKNFPKKPRIKFPPLAKTKKEEYHFLEEIPVEELKKELFKK